MLVLSFRDLAAAVAGAVTPAAMVDLPVPGPAFDWNAPKSLVERLKTRTANYLSWDAVAKALKDKHVCFIVHGFNVNRDHGYAGSGAMAQQLAGLGPAIPAIAAATGADLVVPVLWPGDWYIPGVNYPFELGDVRSTGARFAEFLTSPAQTASVVSFVSHSLGARVVMETVTRASGPGQAPAPAFDLAVLAAGAINDDVLDDPGYAAGVKALRRIVVVSSWKDSVLAKAFPLGNEVEAALWTHDKGSTRALGRYGPQPLKPGSPAAGKVAWYDVDPGLGCGHDGYLPAPWTFQPDHPTAGLTVNGWTSNRNNFAEFLRAAFTPGPFAPPAAMVDRRFGR